MSVPAENARSPAPVRITARSSESLSKFSNAALSAAIVSRDSALSSCGRFKVTMMTDSRRSTWIVSGFKFQVPSSKFRVERLVQSSKYKVPSTDQPVLEPETCNLKPETFLHQFHRCRIFWISVVVEAAARFASIQPRHHHTL